MPIKEGDYVLLYLDERRNFLVKAEKGKEVHTHKGVVKLDDVIGREYGEKVKSHLGVQFILFKPLISDYILKISRKTQILYHKDIGLIILYAGIGPGSKVVEAGTGSGALACCLAYFVRPTGKVFSYEVRDDVLKIAKRNIEITGLSEYIVLKNKDITAGIDENEVDAVVLDMATPWLVVPHAYNALKESGVFASFSPTIDQVVKTVKKLREHNFADIRTMECLLRKYQVEEGRTRPETLMIGHTGWITFARKAI